MDSATSLLASRRMTGVGSILRRVKVLGIEKPTRENLNIPTKKGFVVMCIGF